MPYLTATDRFSASFCFAGSAGFPTQTGCSRFFANGVASLKLRPVSRARLDNGRFLSALLCPRIQRNVRAILEIRCPVAER